MLSEEEREEFEMQLQLLLSQGAIIALMPLEKWLSQFEHADTIGPILDPSLYRKWIYSGRDTMFKEILSAAIEFKHAMQKAQGDFLSGKVQ